MEWAAQGQQPEPAAPGTPPGRPPESEIDARLSAIEDLCVTLARRIDGLEDRLRDALVAEVRTVNADLRHNVSELGRLLVRDLGRLNKLLEHHREAIVADLRPPEPPAPEPPPPVAEPADGGEPSGPGPDGEPGADGEPEAGGEGGEDADGGEEVSGRRRRRGRKARRPSP